MADIGPLVSAITAFNGLETDLKLALNKHYPNGVPAGNSIIVQVVQQLQSEVATARLAVSNAVTNYNAAVVKDPESRNPAAGNVVRLKGSMSILKNAIESIQLGVEDIEIGEAKRLPSAVRNFFAGVLLIFKHKLAACRTKVVMSGLIQVEVSG